MRKLAILAALAALVGCGGGGSDNRQAGPRSPWAGRRIGTYARTPYPGGGATTNGPLVLTVANDGTFNGTFDAGPVNMTGTFDEAGTISNGRFHDASLPAGVALVEGSVALVNGHTHHLDVVAYTVSGTEGVRYVVNLEE